MPDDLNGFARDLFDGLPARYDRLAELLSFGQNGRWRAEMVGHVIPADGVILDVASETAGVALQLAARNARQHGRAGVVGVDLTPPARPCGRALRAASCSATPAVPDATSRITPSAGMTWPTISARQRPFCPNERS